MIFLAIATKPCFGQEQTSEGLTSVRPQRTSVSAGFMMGGGDPLGADLEFLLGQRVGLQAGAGLGSMGFGINIHTKPRINSPYVLLGYWHQGFNENHYASYIGPMYVYRARRFFQAGVGLGTVVSKGPAIEKTKFKDMNATLLFNLGLYFPF